MKLVGGGSVINGAYPVKFVFLIGQLFDKGCLYDLIILAILIGKLSKYEFVRFGLFYVLFSISFRFYLFLSIPVCFCLFLFVSVCFCLCLSVSICFFFRSVSVPFSEFLVRFCPCLSFTVRLSPFLSVSAHFCFLLLFFCPLLFVYVCFFIYVFCPFLSFLGRFCISVTIRTR